MSAPATVEADRFDLLALVIDDCEKKRWPIEPPDPVDAIRSTSKNGKQQPVPPAGRS